MSPSPFLRTGLCPVHIHRRRRMEADNEKSLLSSRRIDDAHPRTKEGFRGTTSVDGRTAPRIWFPVRPNGRVGRKTIRARAASPTRSLVMTGAPATPTEHRAVARHRAAQTARCRKTAHPAFSLAARKGIGERFAGLFQPRSPSLAASLAHRCLRRRISYRKTIQSAIISQVPARREANRAVGTACIEKAR